MRARCTPKDNADENRIAELGKGNIVHINGMSSLTTLLDVNVVRPLLAMRKSDLVDFAEHARGWIGRTLDKIGAVAGYLAAKVSKTWNSKEPE